MRIEEDGGISPAVALSPMAHAPESKYERLIARAQDFPPATTLVVHPCDETSLRGASTPPPPGSSFPSWSDRRARSRQPRNNSALTLLASRSST